MGIETDSYDAAVTVAKAVARKTGTEQVIWKMADDATGMPFRVLALGEPPLSDDAVRVEEITDTGPEAA
jgi:hypothetical protein